MFKINNKGFKYIRDHILLPIIVALFTLYVGVRFINPPRLPEIKSSVAYNSGDLIEEFKSPFKLDFQTYKESWLTLYIMNEGRSYAEDLEVEIRFIENEILFNTKKYNPNTLGRRVLETHLNKSSFYEFISSIPSDSGIDYMFILKTYIKSTGDFKFTVCSKSKNWTRSKKIRIGYGEVKFFLINHAYAGAETEKDNDEEHPVWDTQTYSPEKPFFINGYDPLIMSWDLVNLMETKRIILPQDTESLKVMLEPYDDDFIFGGTDIVDFNSAIVDKLIGYDAITSIQASSILTTSQNSGGVQIDGINPIIFQIGILDSLWENQLITLEEGQYVIDRARVKSDEVLEPWESPSRNFIK